MNIHWKDWYWSWNSNTLVTWCEELTHLKRPWCRERLKAGGEGADRGWDGWMASPTQWTWIWVNSGSLWTGRPGVLQSWGRKESDTTEWLNWTELNVDFYNYTSLMIKQKSCYWLWHLSYDFHWTWIVWEVSLDILVGKSSQNWVPWCIHTIHLIHIHIATIIMRCNMNLSEGLLVFSPKAVQEHTLSD